MKLTLRVLVGCLEGVVTGESEVSLPEAPALEDELDFFVSC